MTMKFKSSVCWLTVLLLLSVGVVGCRKGPQRLTIIPSAAPATPAEQPGPAIPPGPGPGTVIPPSTPPTVTTTDTGPGVPTTPRDFSVYKEDHETFAAQTVYFDFDKAVVKAGEVSKVEAVATQLKGLPGKAVRVEGHCDERGTEEYNRSLGERRALAVREALIRAGIAADLIDTRSYGEDRPADPSHNEAAWAKNRRGVFVLLTPP